MPSIEMYFDSQIVHQKCYQSPCYYRFKFKDENDKEYAQKVFDNSSNTILYAQKEKNKKAKIHYISIALNEVTTAVIYDPENTAYSKKLRELHKILMLLNNDNR